MHNKSLVCRPCDHHTLCGISTSFPVLFPIQRQVAHALLTRPPLTFQEQAPESSVRLECVRHAASVHPEPGSNSQNIVYKLLRRSLFHILSKFAVLLFLLLIYSLFKGIVEIILSSTLFNVSISFVLCTFSRCSIFKDRLCYRSLATA